MPSAGSRFWFEIEDSSAENRELADIIRQLERSSPGGEAIDWEEDRAQSAAVLFSVASSEKSFALTRRLDGVEAARVGDEHDLLAVEDQPDRIFKATHSDVFGCKSYFSPHDPDLTGKHFHGTGCLNPLFYLRRWMLLNWLSGFQTQFEGFLPPEPALSRPRICVSQPQLDGYNPSVRQIREGLARYGFEPVSEHAYLQRATKILLTDAAPRNVWVVDGVPVPFDAIAEIASPRVIAWAAGARPPPS